MSVGPVELLSKAEVCARTGLNDRTVRELFAGKKLLGKLVGGRWFSTELWLDLWHMTPDNKVGLGDEDPLANIGSLVPSRPPAAGELEFINATEAAQLLHVDVKTARSLFTDHKVPAKRMPGGWHTTTHWLASWLATPDNYRLPSMTVPGVNDREPLKKDAVRRATLAGVKDVRGFLKWVEEHQAPPPGGSSTTS
jgi:hypothetical protein